MKHRSLDDDWEMSWGKPSPYEPIIFKIDKSFSYFPFKTASEFVKYINDRAKTRSPQQASYAYDDYHHMPGIYSAAEIIHGEVWLTFTPQKYAGYWMILPPKSTFSYHKK